MKVLWEYSAKSRLYKEMWKCIAALATGLVILGAVIGGSFLMTDANLPDSIELLKDTPVTEEQKAVLRQKYLEDSEEAHEARRLRVRRA